MSAKRTKRLACALGVTVALAATTLPLTGGAAYAENTDGDTTAVVTDTTTGGDAGTTAGGDAGTATTPAAGETTGDTTGGTGAEGNTDGAGAGATGGDSGAAANPADGAVTDSEGVEDSGTEAIGEFYLAYDCKINSFVDSVDKGDYTESEPVSAQYDTYYFHVSYKHEGGVHRFDLKGRSYPAFLFKSEKPFYEVTDSEVEAGCAHLKLNGLPLPGFKRWLDTNAKGETFLNVDFSDPDYVTNHNLKNTTHKGGYYDEVQERYINFFPADDEYLVMNVDRGIYKNGVSFFQTDLVPTVDANSAGASQQSAGKQQAVGKQELAKTGSVADGMLAGAAALMALGGAALARRRK